MTIRVAIADPVSIAEAAERILRGEVVAYPTETLYGLAVHARQPHAVERLLALKGRASSQAIALLVADAAMLAGLVARLPAAAERLIARYWPGPLTLVLPAAPGLAPALCGPGGGVGVRVSSDPVASALVRAVGAPITATSANASGAPPATTAAEAALAGVTFCLDGGARRAAPSTVVELLGEQPRILRAGAIPPEEILG
jgi:L-threonylcarbamoyladenylate synthase